MGAAIGQSEIFRGHDLAIPYRSLAELLTAYRARDPAKLAIVDLDRGSQISYGDLEQVVTDIALHLKNLGVAKGDRVVLLSEENIEKLLIWLGLWRIGAVPAPLNTEMNESHILDLTGICQPKLILVDEAIDPALTAGIGERMICFGRWTGPAQMTSQDAFFSAIPPGGASATIPERNYANDIACMFCTSGTSGKPKVVVYDHAAYWLSGLDSIDMLELTAADRTLEYRSFGWNSAQILSLMPMLQTGLTMYIAKRFSKSRFFDWIRDNEITFAAGVPAVINILLNNDQGLSAKDVPSLTRMTCSSAPLSGEQWKRFEETYGLNLLQLYGMSEAGWICGNTLRDCRVGTVGRPAIHQEFEIVNASGAPLPFGIEGEVTVGGLQVAVGYLMDDGGIDPIRGKRIKTGDLAVMDSEGFVRVTGRTKDLIIRGGVNIAPVEIDGVLLSAPGVLDAAAVGVPDKIYGEEVVAYVVLSPASGVDQASVIAHCRAKLPAAKVPKQVFVVAELPKNDRGKVIRDTLRSDWQDRMRSSA